MAGAFHEAGDAADVKGILLASSGKMFCPGLDLRELVSYDRGRLLDFMKNFHACALDMYTFPKPVVAALSGHALAGGFLLAITADWRILRTGALVGLNEIKVGVPIPFGLSMFLREELPGPRLEEVALFGMNFSDEAAVAAGMVHEIHGEERFEEYCLDRLRELSGREPAAFAATKKYLRAATVERIRAHDAKYVDEFLDCWFLDSTQERIRGIVERLEKRAGR